MSRGFASGVLAKLYALSQSDPMLGLLTVTHASLTTRRHVRNTADVVSNGNTFTAAAFDITLPEERDDAPPRGRLVIDVVDQDLIADLVAITTPATVLIEIVYAAAPDTVLASWQMEARVARWDVSSAEIELHPDPVLDETYPGPAFSPNRFPGLFGS